MSHFHLRLPATSANLGPGFDAVALALELYLEIHAVESETYSIVATGRNADVASRLNRNLMLAVYEDTLRASGSHVRPLSLRVENQIPIGMGCGSSAAARLAGLALANHFGELQWTNEMVLQEGCRLEGHPDNAAACWRGGFAVAAGLAPQTHIVSIDPPSDWRAILVLPNEPLATSAARGLLPPAYTRADAVVNIQNVALLTSAFHLGRKDLLQQAMGDRLHQPYRQKVCPLLPLLLPLAGKSGIFGVALSGAGPAVLAITDRVSEREAKDCIMHAVLGHQAEVISVPMQKVCGEPLPAITEV